MKFKKKAKRITVVQKGGCFPVSFVGGGGRQVVLSGIQELSEMIEMFLFLIWVVSI